MLVGRDIMFNTREFERKRRDRGFFSASSSKAFVA